MVSLPKKIIDTHVHITESDPMLTQVVMSSGWGWRDAEPFLRAGEIAQCNSPNCSKA